MDELKAGGQNYIREENRYGSHCFTVDDEAIEFEMQYKKISPEGRGHYSCLIRVNSGTWLGVWLFA